MPALFPDRGIRPVSRVHRRLIREDEQPILDAVEKLAAAGAGEIVAPDPLLEEGIAAEYDAVAHETYAARAVPGRMHDRQGQVARGQDLAALERDVRLHRGGA